MNEVRDRVRTILAAMSGVSDFDDNETLGDGVTGRGGLGLDSLDRIEVAMELEEIFGIEIPDEHVRRVEMSTPAGIIAYVEARLNDQNFTNNEAERFAAKLNRLCANGG